MKKPLLLLVVLVLIDRKYLSYSYKSTTKEIAMMVESVMGTEKQHYQTVTHMRDNMNAAKGMDMGPIDSKVARNI